MAEVIDISTRAIVRPFKDCTKLFEDGLTCRIASDTEYGRVVNYPELPPDYTGFALGCRLDFSAKDAGALVGVDPADLAFVAVLTVRPLKLSEAINKFDADKIVAGAELKIDDTRIRQLPAGTPFTIELTLVLAREKSYKVGSPWLTGHWVARKILTFNSAPQGKAFNIQSVLAADFPTRFHLPKETFYYVQCSEEDVAADKETFQKSVTVFVREDCYNALVSGGQAPAVDAVYSQMLADIVAQICAKALRNATEATCDEDTVQGALLKRMKKRLKLTIDQLKRESSDCPERFRAMIQAMCDVGPTLGKTVFS